MSLFSEPTRRTFLTAGAASAATTAGVSAVPPAAATFDPLMGLIAQYYRGMEELDLDDEATGAAHSAVVRRLDTWREPARTAAAAAAALKLALYEVDNFSNSPTAVSMIHAAIGFIGRSER